jgi:hypothetical protein
MSFIVNFIEKGRSKSEGKDSVSRAARSINNIGVADASDPEC